VTRLSVPQRLLVGCAVLGASAGGIFGLIRGLHYLPTLPIAIVEGGVLMGVPSAFLGLVLGAGWYVGRAFCRRIKHV